MRSVPVSPSLRYAALRRACAQRKPRAATNAATLPVFARRRLADEYPMRTDLAPDALKQARGRQSWYIDCARRVQDGARERRRCSIAMRSAPSGNIVARVVHRRVAIARTSGVDQHAVLEIRFPDRHICDVTHTGGVERQDVRSDKEARPAR